MVFLRYIPSVCMLYSISILVYMSILRFYESYTNPQKNIMRTWKSNWHKRRARPKSRLILRITSHPRESERQLPEWPERKFGSYRASIIVVRIVTLLAHIRHQTVRNTPRAPVAAGYWGPLITLSLRKIFDDQTPVVTVSVLKCGSLSITRRTCSKQRPK